MKNLDWKSVFIGLCIGVLMTVGIYSTVKPQPIIKYESSHSNTFDDTIDNDLDNTYHDENFDDNLDELLSSYDNDTSLTSTDRDSINLIANTGNWKYIEEHLPNMTKSGIDAVVTIYNHKHISKSEHKKASDYYNK